MNTKENLLNILNQARGTYLSGEEIAFRLSISRGAVWKAVKALQAEGYRIHAVTNKGYCLAENTDLLSAESIRSQLRPELQDIPLEVCPALPSTSHTIRERALQNSAPEFILLAEQQTAGRGHKGTPFFSPPKTGLYMSLYIRSGLPLSQSFLPTALTAAAVAGAIEEMSGEAVQIQWPDHLFQQGKKVAGILTEANLTLETGCIDFFIIGIGVNIFTPPEGFPSKLARHAAPILTQEQAAGGSRAWLAAAVLNRLLPAIRQLPAADLFADYKRRLLLSGKSVVLSGCSSAEISAQIQDILPDGRLLLQLPNGEIRGCSIEQTAAFSPETVEAPKHLNP